MFLVSLRPCFRQHQTLNCIVWLPSYLFLWFLHLFCSPHGIQWGQNLSELGLITQIRKVTKVAVVCLCCFWPNFYSMIFTRPLIFDKAFNPTKRSRMLCWEPRFRVGHHGQGHHSRGHHGRVQHDRGHHGWDHHAFCPSVQVQGSITCLWNIVKV